MSSSKRSGIDHWESLIPALWCEVSEIYKICLNHFDDNGSIISADHPDILALYEGRDFRQKTIPVYVEKITIKDGN